MTWEMEGSFMDVQRVGLVKLQKNHLTLPLSYLIDRELALAVLYVCFRLLVLVLLPFLNFQAQIGNIFFLLIGIFSFF
jgi:hypothetical protein